MSTGDVVPNYSHSEQCVFAKHEYHYTNNKGEVVQMFQGQRFILLDKTNQDWWHVRHMSTTMEMFVPASYMQMHVDEAAASSVNHSSIINSDPISPTVHLDYDPNSSCEYAVVNKSCIKSPEMDYLHDETPPPDYESISFEESQKHNHVSVIAVGNISDVGPRTQVENIVPTKKLDSASSPSETLPGNDEPVVYANLQELKMIRHASQAAKQNEQEYANLSEIQALISKPPKKAEKSEFVKTLDDRWDMYTDELMGRNYYNNLQTGETTWKPPRLAEKIQESGDTDSATVPEKKPPAWKLKDGWSHEHDDNGDTVFVHQSSNEKWLTSVDDNGRRYYYREGTNESTWDLPEVSPKHTRTSLSESLPDLPPLPTKERWIKARSMIIESGLRFDIPVSKSSTLPSILGSSEPLSPLGMPLTRIFLQNPMGKLQAPKDGILNKAKLMEGGRKVKKTWSQSYVVLTGSNLVFYKDQKAAQTKPGSPHGKPEFIVNLHGAKVKFDPKEVTSKKNVILVMTSSDAKFLLQSDDFYRVHNWHEALSQTIQMLNQGLDIPMTIPEGAGSIESSPQFDVSTGSVTAPAKPFSKASQRHAIQRSSSLEDNTAIQERKKSIRNILYHFITRRPSADLLRAKGIIKENVFGCALKQTCEKDHCNVPNFVKQCIAAIESKGLEQDGLYRISGNICQIQRLRMLVDQEQPYSMEDEQWEIHVLTGALKLFFRELKEPLFPFEFYDKFVSAIQLHIYQSRLSAVRDLIAILPKCNHETLNILFYHLKKVSEHCRGMQSHNLAIVFGPTLLWPENRGNNMAISIIYQNKIVEFILLEYANIFR